uniref:Uncharacterized protein n=1 Tax=Kalanchoe fedtschenkoi TaxID=63787 RepID=A0A7N0VGR9_KALFE
MPWHVASCCLVSLHFRTNANLPLNFHHPWIFRLYQILRCSQQIWDASQLHQVKVVDLPRCHERACFTSDDHYAPSSHHRQVNCKPSPHRIPSSRTSSLLNLR